MPWTRTGLPTAFVSRAASMQASPARHCAHRSRTRDPYPVLLKPGPAVGHAPPNLITEIATPTLHAQEAAMRNDRGNRYYVSSGANTGASRPRAGTRQETTMGTRIKHGKLGKINPAPLARCYPHTVCTILLFRLIHSCSCMKTWQAHFAPPCFIVDELLENHNSIA
jgi:hypothetical protein